MLLDSPDSSDTSEMEEDVAADAVIDYSVTPMAVEGDGRARPSRYAKRRGRTEAAAAGGVPPPAGRGRKAGLAPAGIEPVQVDLNLSWDDVGGLDHHVRALKEMVFLPLLYPEVFEKFKMEPPKGVLFYGPPGTGKTLCARALAASCGAVPQEADAVGAVSPPGGVSGDGAAAGPAPVAGAVAPVGGAVGSAPEGGTPALEAAGGADSVTPAPSMNGAGPSAEAGDAAEPAAPPGAVHGPVPQAGTAAPQDTPSARAPAVAADVDAGLVGHVWAGAAAGEAAKQRPRVAFFMRNGADCLSKWVGEAERQLRMTFEAAKKHQPSIIFFDEIDGLAPVRSARQDQIHSSIVSTLLGLMDGLDARGQIVVIGATNRVDSVDPALRRPGRFDRELIFTLPNGVARRKILEIHTTHWKPRPPESAVLDAVASKTVGYCGADLRALCSESALRALRRRYPQIYRSNDKLLIDVEQVRVRTRDFAAAMKEIVPASHRSARTHARPIPGRLAPVLESPFGECVAKVKRIFPQGLTPEVAAVAKGVRRKDDVADDESDDSDSCWSSDAERAGDMDVDISRAGKQRVVHGRGGMDRPVLRPRLLVCGRDGLGQGQIGPALLHHLEGCPVHAIDLPSLLADGGSRSSEEALVTAVREACRAVPSVLYLPHLDVWWSAAHQVLRMTLSIVLRDIPAELPLLVLATAGSTMNELPDEVKDMFADFVEIGVPSGERRLALFAPLRRRAEECPTVTDAVVRRRRAKRRAVVLPKAPPPVAKPPTALDLERREADDEKCIRELRMEMRTFVERLRTDRRFADFRDPVDPTVVTDYLDVIKDPMWIGKISEQVDRGMYPTVLAMVKDFDQLVANVIAYNPPFEEQGAHLCRRAHALVDIVHSWVDNLDPDLVSRCNAIVIARLRRVRLESSGKEAVEAVDAAAEATLPETSLPRSAPAVAVAAAASPPTADAMVVDAASVAAPLPPPRVPGSTDAAGNGPSPVTVVEGKAASGVLKGAAQADHAVVPEGHEVRDKQSVSEDVAVPASVRDVEALVTSWLTITTGMNVDALDTLHARLSCVLHDARRSRDRRSVVESLAAVLVEAGDDPTLRLVQ